LRAQRLDQLEDARAVLIVESGGRFVERIGGIRQGPGYSPAGLRGAGIA
jgi:hypothetical protein